MTLKLLIHAPKGGVGKTTIATNAALLMAEQGKKVLVLKLSSSSLIEKHIQNQQQKFPSQYSSIKIWEPDAKEKAKGLPTQIPGSSDYDIVIADTDDYWPILVHLVSKKRRGWRVICPIDPEDEDGLEAIPDQLSAVVLQSQITQMTLNMIVLPNKCGHKLDINDGLELVKNALRNKKLESYLIQTYLPFCSRDLHPKFIDSDEFKDGLDQALSSIL